MRCLRCFVAKKASILSFAIPKYVGVVLHPIETQIRRTNKATGGNIFAITMFVLRLFFLVFFLGKQCRCLNVTNHGSDIDKLKEIVQQLNASLQHMQTEQIRKEVLFRSEIDQLRNETTHLKAKLYSQSKFFIFVSMLKILTYILKIIINKSNYMNF